MSDQSVFDHKTISVALKEAFFRIKDTELHIEMAVLGHDMPYIIDGSAEGKFYSNGMSIEFQESFFVIPYTSILYARTVKPSA